MIEETGGKNIFIVGLCSLIVVFSLIFIFYITTKAKVQGKEINASSVVVSKLETEKAYVENLLSVNYKMGTGHMGAVRFKSIALTGDEKPISFQQLFAKNGKKKFVIRYSEIGCNTCVNLLFKNRKFLDELAKKFEVLVMVDFKRYQDYVMWKRTSEIQDNIYNLKRNDLVFDKTFEESSYCFIVNEDLTTDSYFKPDNQFPDYVGKYINDVAAK